MQLEIGLAILNMPYGMQQKTCIQLGIEIQRSKYDVLSPVHTRQMNGCKHASISMLIETCPKTNHHKLLNKMEKDVGLEDIHIISLHSHEGESE